MLILSLLFLLSGFSALVYEITWARKLSLIFGTDAYGVATILAVFFGGLALGSYIFSRILTNPTSSRSAGLRGASERMGNPLFLYGILELGIGIYAFLSPLIFELVKTAQSGFWIIAAPSFGSFNLFTFLLSIVALIIPTTLMGATLPAIVAATAKNRAGFLYGINTLGAVLGVLLSGFLLIQTVGVNETIWFAAGINMFICAAAIILSKRKIINEARIQPNIRSNALASSQQYSSFVKISILFSYFLSGFAAIGLEVLWTRVLTMVIGGSVYAFSLVLAAFLIGIALGSLLGSKLFSKTQKPLIWFAVLEIILGLTVILSIYLLGNLPISFLAIFKKFGTSFSNLQFGIFLLAGMPILIPTIIMGIIFPVVVQLGSVGKLYASNTVGGVLGALVTGFLLIPLVGTAKSIVVMAAVYLAIGAVILFISKTNKLLNLSLLFILFVSVFIGLKLAKWEKYLFAAGLYVNPEEHKDMTKDNLLKKLEKPAIIYEAEGVLGYIAVTKGKDGILSLKINGKTDASTGTDMENQLLLGHLPLLLHKDPKDVLVVGLGSGITLGSVLSHPVEKVDAIEIEEKVVEAASFFKEYSDNALKDKRVKLIVADGRNYLLRSKAKYDVITSEPSNPWLSGSSKLFTREYFELLKKSVKDDGVVLHWINLYAIDIDGLKSVIAAFKSIFPQVTVFGIPASNDLALIGTSSPIQLDDIDLKSRLQDRKISKNLGLIGVSEPFEVLAYFLFGNEGVEKLIKGAPVNTDNNPVVEYSAPKNLYSSLSLNPWRQLFENLAPIEKKADDFRAARLLTRIYYIEKNIGEGIKVGEKALEMDTDNAFIKDMLARLYFEDGASYFKSQDFDKAAISYEKSLKQKETAETYFNLGQSYEESNPARAEEAYKSALKLDESLIGVYEQLGNVYIDQGNLNSAIDAFTKLYRREPQNKTALMTLADLYYLRKDFGRASEFAKKALKIDPNSSEAKELLQKLP